LADSYFRKKGIREKVEIIYATPLSGAFTKPIATKMLGQLLEEKKINIVPDFNIEHVDNEQKKIVSFDGREQEFDLLVSVPLNMGSEVIMRSGMGDELNYVPTDKFTLQSKQYENVFVIGDATDIPTSKAGSVVHFAAEILFENLLSKIEGKPMTGSFDGHANCFIETGMGKGTLIDFNYDTEPLPGVFPLPVIGPLGLLEVSRINHWGKLAFKWIYWNILLRGKEIPFVPSHMKMTGKRK
jgi:sulfide:quinone oxidoreductase